MKNRLLAKWTEEKLNKLGWQSQRSSPVRPTQLFFLFSFYNKKKMPRCARYEIETLFRERRNKKKKKSFFSLLCLFRLSFHNDGRLHRVFTAGNHRRV
jgi:hypothetical protein